MAQHAAPFVHTPAAPPGVSLYVHWVAVQRKPLYVTLSPAVYVAELLHAETPAQEPLELDVDEAAGALVVVGVPDPPEPLPDSGHVEPRTVLIQSDVASGYCHAITPAFQPCE